MTNGRLVFCATVVVGFMVTVYAWTPSAQAPSAVSPTTDSDLLVEIRGLRDLNQALGANIRAQLLVGRLQLQEQRIRVIDAQLGEVRRLLASGEGAEIAGRLKRLESDLRESVEPGEQKAIEQTLAELKLRQPQVDRGMFGTSV